VAIVVAMDARRRLLCSLLLAGWLPPVLAQGAGRRVLLVYLPDRPVAHWRGGIALRLCAQQPQDDETRIVPLAGFDWSRLLLDSFASAFTQAYPQLAFVAAYNLCETLAPPERWHLGALHVSDIRVREAIAAQCKAAGANAVIVLDGSNPGDSGRTNPYGSIGLYTRRIDAAGAGVARYLATPRWFVTLRVLDPALQQAATAEGGSLDDAGLRSFEGTADELAAISRGAGAAAVLEALRASVQEGARAAMRNFALATDPARASAAAGIKQPFTPPGPA
jgi:hypothetical protein